MCGCVCIWVSTCTPPCGHGSQKTISCSLLIAQKWISRSKLKLLGWQLVPLYTYTSCWPSLCFDLEIEAIVVQSYHWKICINLWYFVMFGVFLIVNCLTTIAASFVLTHILCVCIFIPMCVSACILTCGCECTCALLLM